MVSVQNQATSMYWENSCVRARPGKLFLLTSALKRRRARSFLKVARSRRNDGALQTAECRLVRTQLAEQTDQQPKAGLEAATCPGLVNAHHAGWAGMISGPPLFL